MPPARSNAENTTSWPPWNLAHPEIAAAAAALPSAHPELAPSGRAPSESSDDDPSDDGDSSGDSDESHDEIHDDGSVCGNKRRSSSSNKRTPTDTTASNRGPPSSLDGSMRPNAPPATGVDAPTSHDPSTAPSHRTPPKRRRGAAACNACRRLKMRCTGIDKGPPCARCKASGHECVFEPRQRTRKGGKSKKVEAMADSVQKMEQTLAVVLQAIGSGMGTPNLVRGSSPPNTTGVQPPGARQASSLPGGAATPARPDEEQLAPSEPRAQGSTPKPRAGSAAGETQRPAPIEPPHPISTLTQWKGSRDTDVPPTAVGLATGKSEPSSRELMMRAHEYLSQPSPGSPRQGRTDLPPRAAPLPSDELNPLGLLAEAILSTFSGDSQPAAATTSGGLQGSSVLSADGQTSPASGKSRAGKSGPAPLGVANRNYFRPGVIEQLSVRKIFIERDLPPTIVDDGLVSFDELTDLFRIFTTCNHFAGIIDPVLHTPNFVRSRSPFLLTVIILIASQFYAPRPELHDKAVEYARRCSNMIVENGWKSIEITQAYLLLSLWGESAPNFEQDKAWLYSGLGIRMATDMNLDRTPVPRGSDPAEVLANERDRINRERTWLGCFIVDRMLASQMGKAYIVREDDAVRSVRTWCMQRMSQPWDVGVAGLTELHRIQSRQMDFLHTSLPSLSGDSDFAALLRIFNRQLDEWRQVWHFENLLQQYHLRHPQGQREKQTLYTADGFQDVPPALLDTGFNDTPRLFSFEGDAAACKEAQGILQILSDGVDDPSCNLRPPPPDSSMVERSLFFLVRVGPMRFHYAVLLLNSFGLQRFMSQTSMPEEKARYYFRCKSAALSIIKCAAKLGPDLRYAPDSQFLMIAYAAFFLLKLARPVFAGYTKEAELFDLVKRLANFLASIAVNHTHTPYLYATFLRTVFSAHEGRSDASGSMTSPDPPMAHLFSRSGSPTAPAKGGSGSPLPPALDPLAPPSEGLVDSGTGTPSPLDYPTAAQFLLGLPLMPGGRVDEGLTAGPMVSTMPNMWQQELQLQPDLLMDDGFWSSFLPPGFGSHEPAPAIASGTTPGPVQGTPQATPAAPSLAAPKTMGTTAYATPQSWFSFPQRAGEMSTWPK